MKKHTGSHCTPAAAAVGRANQAPDEACDPADLVAVSGANRHLPYIVVDNEFRVTLRVLSEGKGHIFPICKMGLARLASEATAAQLTLAQREGWVLRRGAGKRK